MADTGGWGYGLWGISETSIGEVQVQDKVLTNRPVHFPVHRWASSLKL